MIFNNFGSIKYFSALSIFILLCSIFAYSFPKKPVIKEKTKIKVGAEVFFEKHLESIKGKSIGIVTNHSALLQDGRHIVDVLNSMPDIKIKALFGPEHGIRGDAPDGKSIDHNTDLKTGIKVFSLYGKTTKPTKEMLDGIDLLIFDIQDVGVRFYTFISTLFLTMEAAAENNIDYLVFDRPNPISYLKADGFMLDDSLKSFVGQFQIPMMHGMTVGEIAGMINGESLLKNRVKAKLRVIKMEGWSHNLWYDETSVPWVKPSPNMMNINTAALYPGICLIEGTNLSEGRGTLNPFEIIGAPFIKSDEFSKNLNGLKLKGVIFEPVSFTPKDILRMTTDPKYDSVECHGIRINISDRKILEPVKLGVNILYILKKAYPSEFKWRAPSRSTSKFYIDLLAGTKILREMLDAGKKPSEIISSWKSNLARFNIVRNKYLIYK